MAHFARLNNEGVVTSVMRISDEDISDVDGNEIESEGVALCRELVDDPESIWVQTSIRTRQGRHPAGRPLRGHYAGIGDIYNEEHDCFMPQRPYPSWTLELVPLASEEDETAADEIGKVADSEQGSDLVHDVPPREKGKMVPCWMPPVLPPEVEVDEIGQRPPLYWNESDQVWQDERPADLPLPPEFWNPEYEDL